MNRVGLESLAHTRFLSAQRIYRFVATTEFQDAVSCCRDDEYVLIQKLVNDSDIVRLKAVVKEILNRELGLKTVANLRKLAQSLRIEYYNYKDKETLIREISAKTETVNDERPSDEMLEAGGAT